ncbi:cytosol aminopeptidase [Buchnera aphidicola str. Bp (Baizongia pistaciae)]|uniref:Probable cytosol aminopeptidase n=1 Tax=Buchnera aphidicola subsp. Baizongia pistaciae (strain Bp) TaxID=224915 RepID=AMPA_BUCBP|nr:leucyl aminopeptidase [Buchnera aphidicola]Q89AG2.1 RecName: Full=Probable cytosol aminopeptidase; AltName: Full=Leucine aminopeptidase; Short=LAP; AltName: Full=Leucyl aminopeptidase [Buchnera aphidicola str. Bp (Baizongia pistaciae)]AAO27053.1 cytosol aminopeptidase [Buchnera aphidicola str. Bp (Baizongia pistaciae)]
MRYHISTNFFKKKYSDCLVFGIFDDLQLCESVKVIDSGSDGYVSRLIKDNEISGQINESLLLHSIPNFQKLKILFLGCGKKERFNINLYQKLFKTSINIIKKLSVKALIYFVTDFHIKNINTYWKIRHAVSEIQDNLYSFKNFKTSNNKNKFKISLEDIYFYLSDHDEINSGNNAIQHGYAISKGKKIARDLSNMPPNICNSSYLADQAMKLSQYYPDLIDVEIINDIDMNKLGMNAYLSVGKGSKNKSLMSIIKYHGISFSQCKNIILIGKGVTFDSGGISIKTSRDLDEMKFDMSGAAIVFGLMSIISDLKLPLNIIGILAGSENMVSSMSFRPGDILTTMSGKTVEILNTDAEGRLILCDVLTYVERFSPEVVIDIATLTGACVVALGHHTTGLLSNNDILAKDLQKASKQTRDLIWRMPLFEEYYKDLDSNVADMANVGTNSAGMITAACFLSKFSQKYAWAHLDVAGTAWISGKNKGSTGRPINLLTQFLLNKLYK